MKKKTLWTLTLAIAACGMMVFAGGCKDKKGDEQSSSSSSSEAPSYFDEIEESPTHYGVKVTEGEGYKIHAASSVAANGNLEFTVQFDENYDGANAVVKANGETVTPVEGKYVLQNVTKDVTLTVSGLQRSTYSVLLTATDGVLLTGASSVKVGESYSFTVALENGVTKKGDFAVKVNGEVVTSATDTYTVANVNKDLIITVGGVNVPYYAVSGLAGTGYSVEATATQIMQGKTFSFAVNVDEAYEKSADYTVKINGNAVTATKGIYTVENVQENLAISVSGLSLRQTFTVTYVNCDLPVGTVYAGTLFHLPTPTREAFAFNGWKDEHGEDYVMDQSGADVTVYASWVTADGVDYVSRYEALTEEMAARYDNLKAANRLQYLNVEDYQKKEEYLAMYDCFTDYEKTAYTLEEASTTAFLAEAEYIPYAELLNIPADISVSYDKEGTEVSYSGYKGSQLIGVGEATTPAEALPPFHGAFFSMQSPSAEAPSLTYYFTLNKINLQKQCEKYGRVSLFMRGNYAGLSLYLGETMLAYTLAQHELLRIDIQDGYLYVNGDCRLKLSDGVYGGEESLRFTVVRKPSNKTETGGSVSYTGHYFARWEISHVYGGKKMEGYSTTVGESSSLRSIRDNIFSTQHTGEAATPPAEMAVNGVTKTYTYEFSAMSNLALDDMALGEYDCVKFFVKVTGNVNLWKPLADQSGWLVYHSSLTDWTEIKLQKNGSGYDMYVGGSKSSRISNITNLNALAFNGHAEGTITYTNLIAEL